MTKVSGRLLPATLLTVAGGFALALALWPPTLSQGFALAAAAAFLAALPFLFLTAREDLDAVLLWIAGMGLGCASILAVYLFSAYRPGDAPRIAAALCAVAGALALAWTLKRQWGPEDPDYPDLLRKVEGLGPVRESNQVQLAALVRPGSEAHPHQVEVYLQSCCDGPRTVTYRLEGPLTGKVKVPVPGKLELGPAEVRRLVLPVVAGSGRGSDCVDVLLGVAGREGRRIRLRRARRAHRYSRIYRVGYLRARIEPQPDALWDLTLPAPRNEPIWQPRRGAPPGGG